MRFRTRLVAGAALGAAVLAGCARPGPPLGRLRGESGVRAALRAWARPPAAAPELNALVLATWDLHDARLFARLQGVAADGRRPAEHRLAALRALARYADPALLTGAADLEPAPPAVPSDSGTVARYLGGVDHVPGVDTVRALAGPAAPRVMLQLEGLRGDPARRVGRAAELLYQSLGGPPAHGAP